MKKYFKHKIENLLNISRIITVHYFEFDKDFKSKGESHDFWEIVYADKNDIILTADNENLILKEGEIYFHKPNEYHTHSADGINPPNVFISSFESRSEAMRFFENRKILLEPRFKTFISQIVSEAKMTFDMPVSNPETKKLELLHTTTLGGRQIIKNTLELLLINIMREQTETMEGNSIFLPERQLDKKLVKDIIQILNKNVTGRISIEEITNFTFYGRAYLFREFKKSTGHSIMEYYNNLKIEKAKELIAKSDKSIREISEILCYDTPNYFSKSFKKATGFTPSEYKKLPNSTI